MINKKRVKPENIGGFHRIIVRGFALEKLEANMLTESFSKRSKHKYFEAYYF